MQDNTLLKRGLHVSGVFIAAAFATFTLFIIMLALIATSFEKRKPEHRDIQFVYIDTQDILPEIKAKRIEKDVSLLKPVTLPPTINTKTATKSLHIPTLQSAILPIVKLSNSKPELSLENISPIVSFSNKAIEGRSSDSGRNKKGLSASQGGANHCTLIAHIGPTARDVAQVEFIDCRNGSIATAAERELYHWVEQGADSFVALGAEVGDAVEFTYETKRR